MIDSRGVRIGGLLVLAAALGLGGTSSAAPGPDLRPSIAAPRSRAAVPQRSMPRFRRAAAYPAPTGCKTTFQSFVGLSGDLDEAGSNTAAGGSDTELGAAGVVAGNTNLACDDDSMIGGGYDNTIGGDDYARYSLIGAGVKNSIEGSCSSVIAGGEQNIMSYAAPYATKTGTCTNGSPGFSFESGILAGASNVVAAPLSGIVAGVENEIIPMAAATPADMGGQSAFIGGGEENHDGANYASIVGGSQNTLGSSTANAGDYGFIGGGIGNALAGEYAAIAGGGSNSISSAAMGAFDGAGYDNVVGGTTAAIVAGNTNTASALDSAVVNGLKNRATQSFATIVGGMQNVIDGSGTYAFLGNGSGNTLGAEYGFLGGGLSNSVGPAATYGVVVGGNNNSVTGVRAFIGSGYGNTASAEYAMVPGGDDNSAAGEASFAAGRDAHATQNGSFVWGDDSGGPTVTDSKPNQFVARAVGGFYLYSSDGTSGTNGVRLPGGSGTWSSMSDRNAKTAIVPLDDAATLARVATLPISSWQYKSERGVRHIGPMAQDFYAAFGVGEDDRHITSIDEDGVALAAIKALSAKNDRLARDNADLHADVAAMHAQLARLESALAELKK